MNKDRNYRGGGGLAILPSSSFINCCLSIYFIIFSIFLPAPANEYLPPLKYFSPHGMLSSYGLVENAGKADRCSNVNKLVWTYKSGACYRSCSLLVYLPSCLGQERAK